MIYYFKVTIVGLVSGMIGTGIGGLAVFFISKINKRFLSLMLEFSAGLMTAVVCFKLIPEAIGLSGIVLTLLGVLLGVLSIITVEELMKKRDGYLQSINEKKSGSGMLRAGILMAIGISLHNFPEGFAVGAGFEASINLGLMLTVVIVMHDIPEGIAMAVPMRLGGYSPFKAYMLTLLSGAPMGIGALFGAMIGRISMSIIGVCLGFAAGAMLYVVYGQLIIESKKLYIGRLPSIGNVLGIICGIIISKIN
ncbi:UNVERIFIED_CONTAM: ZIP family zinc transporter [Acetivibrio alkalicellulosi]